MALFDLLGKFAGLPLYALLGGDNNRPIFTDMTVGIDNPEKMGEKALEYKRKGFPAIKVKLGTSMTDDVARVRAIRKVIGDDTTLRIDANQGWDYVTAVRTLKALESYGIEYCEQPVPYWDYSSLARVRTNSPIPIVADESLFDHHDAYRLASMNAVDYFNIKLGRSGGIRNSLRILAIADAAGIKCMVGCTNETRLALTAASHLATARTAIRYYDLDSALSLAEDPVVGGITYGDMGSIIVPDRPGLGADIDQKYLDKMPKLTI